MTQDEVIEMARQAGLLVIDTSNGDDAVYTWPKGITEELEAFAKLVAEKEREACAKIVEESYLPDAYSEECLPEIADEIRARGEK